MFYFESGPVTELCPVFIPVTGDPAPSQINANIPTAQGLKSDLIC